MSNIEFSLFVQIKCGNIFRGVVNLKISTRKNGNTIIVLLDGELDHHTAEKVRTKLDLELISGGVKNMIFDFSKVSFMDSSGIGVIIGRQKNVARLGGKTAVVGMNAQTRKILELTGFKGIIPFFESIEQASKAM